MARFTGRWRMWRRVVACTAAYAIVLQSILLAAIAPAPVVAGDFPAAEICGHQIDRAPSSSDVPTGHDAGSHCKSCLAGHISPLLASPPAHALSIVLVETAAIHPVGESDAPNAVERKGEPPRGPPLQV